MSERFAKEVGVRMLNDSLTINSTLPGAMNGQMGTVENMQIGSMIFHYPLITVAPPNALDSVMRVDAILGMDFINLFDELRIYPKEKKMVLIYIFTLKNHRKAGVGKSPNQSFLFI